MANVNIGGSSNVTINGSSTDQYFLTGLDANGKVLSEINVKIIAGTSPATMLFIYLPDIASLNFRNITFNIDMNDYTTDVNIAGGSISNSINGGFMPVNIGGGSRRVVPVQSLSWRNWFVPALDLA